MFESTIMYRLMKIKAHTIFSRIYHAPLNKNDKNIEDKKISSWLKKLFIQRQQKIIADREKQALVNSEVVKELLHKEKKASSTKQSPEQKDHEADAQIHPGEAAKDKH